MRRRVRRWRTSRGRATSVVAVALGVLLALAGCGADAPTRDAGGDRAARPPEPEVGHPYVLWLSAERVPASGAEVVAVLVNQSGRTDTFGVHADVERWDGTRWERHGEVVMCMDHWHCTAEIVDPGEVEGVPAIGLSAHPGESGAVERFSTDGLDVGWYRVVHTANEGTKAAGVFEVADGADPPAPLAPVDAPASRSLPCSSLRTAPRSCSTP